MIGPPVRKLREDKERSEEKSKESENNKDNESSSNIKKENLSNISTTKIEKEKENEERIQKFITKNDSLYLSASKIAGCCGLNPWCNIPKITIDLIYQGRTGRELLLNDANTIGLELQTDEEILSSFASKAGDDTINAFKHALKVKPKTIQEVEEIQKKVVECANKSNKLKEFEMKALEDGVRHILFTGFGTMHEEDVLDLYEVQYGWNVRERNAVIREWPFIRNEDVRKDGGEEASRVSNEKSAVPLRHATEMIFKHREKKDEDKEKADIKKDEEEEEKKEDNQKVKKRRLCNDTTSSVDNTQSTTITFKSDEQPQSKEEDINKSNPESDKQSTKEEEQIPYFSILGAVDGIRDELIPSPSEEDDEYGSSFSFQEVVIECKHRMRKCTIPPPLYDQIQAVAYCFMYNTTSAEIVQALRNENAQKEITPSYEMHTSKITLNDPIYNHENNFNTIILPRLRSFVDMVYEIRSNNSKRMQFLLFVACSLENEKLSWEFLFRECDWLVHCDTAWKRL